MPDTVFVNFKNECNFLHFFNSSLISPVSVDFSTPYVCCRFWDKWTSMPSLPIPMDNLVMVAFKNRVYTLGGSADILNCFQACILTSFELDSTIM
jgi:hypothetical protein